MGDSGHRPPGELPGFRSRRIYRELLGRIRRRYRPGQKLGTEVQLARQFGVAPGTMAGVLSALARDGVVVRTRGLGTMVADHPMPLARRVGLVGLPVDRFWERGRFYADLFAAMMATLTDADVTVQRFHNAWLEELRMPGGSDTPPGWPGELATQQLAQVDALVVLDPGRIDVLESIGRLMPVVAANVPPAGGGISYVAFDHAAGVEQAIDHLWALGHRRIGCWGQLYVRRSVTSPDNREARYDAFVENLSHRLGQPPDITWMQLAWDPPSWEKAVDRWLAKPPHNRPTAIVCRGGAWALLWELIRRGVRVGREVSVVALERIPSVPDCLDVLRQEYSDANYRSAEIHRLEHRTAERHRLFSLRPTAVLPDTASMGEVIAHELLGRIMPGGAPATVRLVGSTFREGNTTARPAPSAC